MAAFRQYLGDLQGRFVQVGRGAPDACCGWLQSVQADFITLFCPDFGILHLPAHHIRSIGPAPAPEASPVIGEPVPQTFVQLLVAHAGLPVRLNHACPESTAGTLLAVAADHLVLAIEPEEVVCFPLFHVRSLSVPESVAPPAGVAEPPLGV